MRGNRFAEEIRCAREKKYMVCLSKEMVRLALDDIKGPAGTALRERERERERERKRERESASSAFGKHTASTLNPGQMFGKTKTNCRRICFIDVHYLTDCTLSYKQGELFYS